MRVASVPKVVSWPPARVAVETLVRFYRPGEHGGEAENTIKSNPYGCKPRLISAVNESQPYKMLEQAHSIVR